MNLSERYDSLFQWYGQKYKIDWHLLKRQALAESNLNPDAESLAGAQGLCQFMPATFKEWSAKLKLIDPSIWNPEHQIACQAAYLDWLLGQVNGELRLALAAYNFGLTRVKRGDDWPLETQNYVDKILLTQV